MQHKPKPPSMIQAGVYSGVRHYLQAVQACGSTDSKTVAAKMREMKVNDMYNHDVTIRPDERVLHTTYLMQVKAPGESRGRFDLYKSLATIPGDQAFRPVTEGNCPLVKA